MVKRKIQQPETISPAYIKKLKDQRRSLGLLQFESRNNRNFTKWENMTENLVISYFGEDSNQHTQFTDLVYKLVDESEPDRDIFSYKMRPKELKEKMKDLLTNFIS